MQLTSFSPNHTITLFEKQYSIQSIADNRKLFLRDSSGNTRSFDIDVLIGHYLSGNLRGSKIIREKTKPPSAAKKISFRPINDVSEVAKSKSFLRSEYLTAIHKCGIHLQQNNPSLNKILKLVAQRLNQKHPPSFSTLKRWSSRLQSNGGDPAALIPYYERRGAPGKCRLPLEVVSMMRATIDNEYLTTTRESASKSYEVLCANVAKANQWRPSGHQFPTPSFSTFLRLIKKMPGYEVTAARFGAAEAKRQYRSSGRNTESYPFNGCWEVDHQTLDVFVVDEHTGLVLGRPRFTVMIESVTRMPMGFDIGFTGTSAQSVLNCLKHAILPKSYLKEKYPEVQGEWPCFGTPLVLKCDNGPEFHSVSLKEACFELSIELQYCPIKAPWFKGRVERFFRTFSDQFAKMLPGSTGSHLYNRPEDTDPSQFSTIDLKTLHRLVHIWLVDIYMTGRHGGAL